MAISTAKKGCRPRRMAFLTVLEMVFSHGCSAMKIRRGSRITSVRINYYAETVNKTINHTDFAQSLY